MRKDHVENGKIEVLGYNKPCVAICRKTKRMPVIMKGEMFLPYRGEVKVMGGPDDSRVHFHLSRKNGKIIEYVFDHSVTDIALTEYPNESVHIYLEEFPDEVPCLLLMCAEDTSLFTETVPKMKRVSFRLETLTEDDDLLSRFGMQKWKLHEKRQRLRLLRGT